MIVISVHLGAFLILKTGGMKMFKLLAKEADKAHLSLPKSRKVCGYEIKKMPIGAYLKAMERIQGLPDDFISQCFPGLSLQEVLDKLSNLDEHSLVDLIMPLFQFLPSYFIGVLSELTGIPEERLVNDENIGLYGFAEIIKAFVEVNQLGKLTGEAGAIKRLLIQAAGSPTPDTGFNA